MENSASTTSNGTETGTAVPAVGKAVKILDAVGASAQPLGISEIARAVGLSKSTVHGLTSALLREGFLAAANGGRGYTLGPHLRQLGMKVRDDRVVRLAEGQLEEVARRSGQTAFFGRLEANRVVILARCESARTLNLSAQVGSSVPLTAGALCKSYLAALGPARARKFLERTVLPRYTDRSVTDSRSYLEQVAEAAAVGYARDRGEYLPGVSAVASSFLHGADTYFVWAVGIDSTYSEVELDQVGAAVRDASDAILDQMADRGDEG